MAPFFLKADQAGLHEYIHQIADAGPLPVGIYSHFKMPSVFDVATVASLAEHPNIVVIKDTHTDPQLLNSYNKYKDHNLHHLEHLN